MTQTIKLYLVAAAFGGLGIWLLSLVFLDSDSDRAGRQASSPSERARSSASAVGPEGVRTPSSTAQSSIWRDERLFQEQLIGRYQRPLAEQLRIEAEVEKIGDLFVERREYEAMGILRDLVEKHPDVPEYRAMLGYLYYRWDDYPRAREQWEVMVELDPNNEVIRVRLADALMVLGESSAAREHLQFLLSRNPGNEGGVLGMWTLMDFESGPDAALRFVESHYQANRNEAGAASAYGQALLRAGQLDRAEQVLQRSLERNPNHFSSLYQLSSLKAQAGNFSEASRYALQAYRAAQTPADRDAVASLHTESLIQEGRFDEYVDFLELRVAENPNDIGLQAQLVRARNLRNQFQ
ncbi:MAG: tetratricopeptide repeat protein [Bradymonadales bacterium]|nr:MAG: tetratricopeptide repeat protein [Bradymonadales bacterium]